MDAQTEPEVQPEEAPLKSPKLERKRFDQDYVDKLGARLRDMPKTQAEKLPFGKLKEASFQRREFCASVPANSKSDVVLNPAYWAHHVKVLMPNDKIEAFCEDGTWEGLYRVMYVGEVEVTLSPIYVVEHEKRDVEEESLYYVKWISPTRLFGVFRKDSNEKIADGFRPKARAYDYITAHSARMR
jgi:hypothetical protein